MILRRLEKARSFRGINVPMLNADADWDRFSPSWYKEHNYAKLGNDDRQIMASLRNFFASSGVRRGRGLDVGTGSNLYPALGMLPFCREIDLLDCSEPNVKWLKHEIKNPSRSWDPYWAVLQSHPIYAGIGNYREFPLVGSVRLIPTLGFENKLQRDTPNVTHLRAWTVQRYIDADAAILKIVFESFTIDFHLSQAHHCFKRNAIVSALDLATVVDGFLRQHNQSLNKN